MGVWGGGEGVCEGVCDTGGRFDSLRKLSNHMISSNIILF